MAQFVDWDLAAATAGALGKSGPRVSYAEATDVVADLRRLTDEAAGHVADYTGLRSQVAHPPVRVVDRRDWAATNIAGLREVITPLVGRLAGDKQPGALTEAIGSRVTGVQAGTVLAYLSGRVLGQYEVFSADPGQLLLVAPNIVEVERKLGADPRDFRLWVCLHEVTHRTQFTAVPWMRAYFLGEVQAFVDASPAAASTCVERLRRGVATLVRRGPRPGEPGQRAGHRADPGAAGRAGPAHRADDPAGGARRVRDGRRRPAGHPDASSGSGPVQPAPRGAATRWRRRSAGCSASTSRCASTPRAASSSTASSSGSAWTASTRSSARR